MVETGHLHVHARICESCGHLVDRREAVVRSASLQRVHFHRDCWEAEHGPVGGAR